MDLGADGRLAHMERSAALMKLARFDDRQKCPGQFCIHRDFLIGKSDIIII
jgi:hypothetical protein